MSDIKSKFFVDAMLGKLAKKLRVLGYDSVYSSDKEDDEIINIAKNENRILITKDSQLAKKGIKKNVDVIEITGNDEIEQFLQINKKVNLGKCVVSGKYSRCSVCNGELESIDKIKAQEKIPPRVSEQTNEFWQCKKCQKIYWEGTHIQNLQKFVGMLNDRL